MSKPQGHKDTSDITITKEEKFLILELAGIDDIQPALTKEQINLVNKRVNKVNAPHVHKDLIIAWANNPSLVIQWYNQGTWEDCSMDCPAWNTDYSYRIKPEPLEVSNNDTHIGFTKGNAAICIKTEQLIDLCKLAQQSICSTSSTEWVEDLKDILSD